MYKFLTKNGQALAFGLGVVVTIIFMLIVFSGVSEFSTLPIEEQAKSNIFNFGLVAALALTVLTVAALVVFGLLQVVGDVKGSLKGLIGFGALVIVAIIAYATASTEVSPYIQGAIDSFTGSGNSFTDGNLKFITASITVAAIVTILAAVTFVGSEIRNFFK
ncbi:MAG TPA: hypothetical protein PKA00_21020 [Saprospiraceae bacterium]|nr:hypothetical protein [Saprospiraceae bacterium]HMQ85405.1 hypothetical protein [Saprospiraceae bacterium]